MNLDLCSKCDGHGFIKKAVFPNSFKKEPCPRCEARLKKVMEDPQSNVNRALASVAALGALAKAQS